MITEGLIKNTARVMEYVFRHPLTTRVQIANHTGMTPAAVTNTTTQLVAMGIIRETGDEVRGSQGSGRSRKLIAINEDFACFGGMEIHTHGVHLTLINLAGKILYQKKVPLEEISLDAINEDCIDLIHKSLEESGIDSLMGFGIAVAGHAREDGTVLSNNPRWNQLNIHQIAQAFPFPFWAHNNIETMSLDQYLYGRLDAPERFAYLHIGSGLFCSFFNASKLGAPKSAYLGEVGHMVVERNGSVCECGKRGCLQTYLSETWLVKKAGIFYDAHPDSYLHLLAPDKEALDMKVLMQAYQAGDPDVVRLISDAIEYLAISLANMFLSHEISQIYINARLLQDPSLQKILNEKLDGQLSFMPVDQQLSLDILPFDPYRGSQAAASLAVYYCFIKEPQRLYDPKAQPSAPASPVGA